MLAGYLCPALDPVEGKGAAYDPASVDWDAVVADIMKIGALEPRFCNMAIRAWFHDVSAFGNSRRHDDGVEAEIPFDTVSDGSIFTNEDEAALPVNSHHGFGRIIRHIVVQVRPCFYLPYRSLDAMERVCIRHRFSFCLDFLSSCCIWRVVLTDLVQASALLQGLTFGKGGHSTSL